MALTIDGTNGIETNTDTGRIKVGASDDLSLYHGGTDSVINNATGHFYIQGENQLTIKANNNVEILKATGDEAMAKFIPDGAVELYYDNSKKAATHSSGFKIWSGNLYLDSDNAKAIFGAGDDLQIHHTSNVNYIDNNGTTNLEIRSNGGSEYMASFLADGAVKLYHNNHYAFNTSSTGIEVRGPEGGNCELYLYADEGDDNADLWVVKATTGGGFYIQNKSSGSWETSIFASGNGAVQLYYDDGKRLETDSNGMKIYSDGTASEIEMRTSSETYRGSVYANNGDYIGFLDHSGNWVFKTQRDTETEFHQTNIVSDSDNSYNVGSSSKRWDNIHASNGTIQTSDRNEKNTIVESDLGLSFVNKLKPVSYKFNGKTRTHYGLIAQDIETTLSDIGKTTTDFAGFIKSDIPEEKYQDKEPLPEGKAIGDVKREAFTSYGLRYAEFISPLVKAVQELSTEVETLKTKVAALEGS